MSNETNATIDEIMKAAANLGRAEVEHHNMPSSLRAGVCERKGAALRHLVTKALGSQAQQIAALSQELTEASVEIVECDALRADMAAILRAVAIAVRGPEVDGISWGWADLPDRATAAMSMMAGAIELAREHAAEIEALKRGRRSQHDTDSAELRRLCAERDELRKRLTEIEYQEPAAKIKTWHKSGEQHADLIDWCDSLENLPDGEHKLYASPVPAIPGEAEQRTGAIPTVVTAVEFRRQQYELDQRQWAWVLGMQPSHYSEFVAGQRGLPKSAMALAFAYGVPAAALFQRLPNLGATDIDRRLTHVSVLNVRSMRV